MMDRRESGLLCHVTSLPSPFGIGDLGPAAYDFVDFLAAAKQGWWQVLPVGPFTAGDISPYRPASAFAGNPLLISPELLAAEGWLDASDLDSLAAHSLPTGRVDFDAVLRTRPAVIERACRRFLAHGDRAALDAFCERNSGWLDAYVRWRAREHADRSDAEQLERCMQYLFDAQWARLRAYAHSKGVRIFGDVPFYVDEMSADVAGHPELFKLDDAGRPRAVSGVPPDAFSETGQLWGNPVYDWEEHARDGHAWWVARIARTLERFDLVRLDHFRAIAAHWEVPAGSETAMTGAWVTGPGRALLDAFAAAGQIESLVAEDLGTITEDVHELMRGYDLPGMKVLLFAFDSHTGGNLYAPHHHVPNGVVYTGTHDNNTARGWFEDDATPETRAHLTRYLGRECSPADVGEALVRMALASVCRLSILPVQDVLGLDGRARMNHPARANGNWTWRLEAGALTPQLAQQLGDMTEAYGRTGASRYRW
ncbi:MAG TPA: 4-alpha-glucanotransferase [Candidatus Krumholzibacteria bacterium]